MSEQVYFILEQNIGWVKFDSFYTSDIGTVVSAVEKARNTGKNIKVYYFPQMKEIKNLHVIFEKGGKDV